MKLKLINKRPEAGDAVTLVFQPEMPLTWQAGQYLQYTLPHTADDRGNQRWFTISAAPFEKNVQITTRFFAKPSSFKKQLQELAVGDEIEAGQPEGEFVITDPDKSYILIAGGIGITPIRSILAQADHDGQKLDACLLYGSPAPDKTVYKTELDQLAQRNPRLKISYIYEPDRITPQTIAAIPDFRSKYIYVSGPEPMVEAFEKILKDLGIPEAHQQRDYFPGYEWSVH